MLYNISRVRLYITQEGVLIQALVISCLDYCNTLLAGLPMLFNLPKFSHVTLFLRTLH